ncbi:hypothetical protein ACK33O_01670 [Aeromonas hydrophila]|uniref:hypothetical protein n=1 Tax=Aeromonas hydrophila TaxID=644 RepID=UPI001F009742|nr:hypothetical protein [Aeromonas hydrophila]MCP3322863.1 hypothetical protein [Aeromonas hydrophila]
MSDIIKIARQAPKVVEGLLADMFAANAEDNRIALGGVYSGQQYIQLQLVATSNPADLLDDDDEVAAPLPAHNQLTTHWLAARAEFIAAGGEARGDRDIPRELLALGAVRSVYWLALGQGATVLAKEIGEWWQECAPLHGQGEVIK